MATIGSLAVNIVATTDEFVKGINSARSKITEFIKGIDAMSAAVDVVAGTIFAKFVNSAVETGGQLQELTKKIGISAEELTALHYAADQLESSASAVDTALLKMSLTLGKAAAGNDKALDAFNTLGINIEKLQKLSRDQQFLVIIDALKTRFPDAADRAAAAAGVFSKSYAGIIPLVDAGSKAIAAQGMIAAQTGSIISTDTVAALDDLGDANARLYKQWENLKLQSVSLFAPFLEFIAWLGGKALLYIRGFGYATQGIFIAILEGIAKTRLAAADMMNVFLPKALEFDTERLRNTIDTYSKFRQERFGKAADMGYAAAGMANPDNPLANQPTLNSVRGYNKTNADWKSEAQKANSDKKEEEKAIKENTKETAAQLKEMVGLMKQGYSASEATIKVVGVR